MQTILKVSVCVLCASAVAFNFAPYTAEANSIAPDKVKIVENAINAPLTDVKGDSAAGKKWFANRKLGNCLACHANAGMTEKPFHGEIGPPIDGVAERLTAPEMRAILVNSKAIFGKETIMPGFYKVDPGKLVAKSFKGKTILSGQQIEDIIAYLLTLKE